MIQEFLDYQRDRKGLSENTIESYKKDLAQWVVYAKSKDLRWSTITKQDIDTWLISMHKAGKKPATINRHLSSLRGLLTWAHHEKLLTDNPARYCQLMKQEEKLPEQAPTDAIKRYLSNEPTSERSEVMHALIAILYDTGIRIQEALDLMIEDFDTNEMSIKIKGKGSQQRKVFYSTMTITHLVRIGGRYGRHLFPQYEQRTYRMMMYEELKPIGIRTHPHALRHSFATRMLNNGADIKIVSWLLGHKSVKTTERYAKVANETARQQYRQYNN